MFVYKPKLAYMNVIAILYRIKEKSNIKLTGLSRAKPFSIKGNQNGGLTPYVIVIHTSTKRRLLKDSLIHSLIGL
jgi:hypothetical protein